MRLSFATLKYYPFGGLEKSFLNICKEALRRGHELTLYCYKWQGEKLPGANIIEVPLRSLSNHGRIEEFHAKVMAIRSRHLDDVFVGFKRMPDLDVYYNGDVCFKNEVTQKHAGWYRLTSRYRVLSSFEDAIFSPNSATQIMYVSEQERQIFQREYQTPDERFSALPPGIDKTKIRQAHDKNIGASIRAEFGATDSQLVFVMVGSDFQRKGVDRAIRAIAALPESLRNNAQLWVVGEGKAPRFKKLAASLSIGSQVHFLGGRSDVPDILSAANVLIHSAVTEAAGNAILEGMVSGLPVIVSRSAGFSYHVERADAGIVVNDVPFNQTLFDEALKRLAEDGALRERLSKNGWEYADRVDLYRRPQVAVDIIEGVAQRKSERK